MFLLEVLLPPLKTDACFIQGCDLTEGRRLKQAQVRRSEGGETVLTLVIICHHATLKVKFCSWEKKSSLLLCMVSKVFLWSSGLVF